MRIAFYGSSLLSSWWNGAATYYRGLLRDLASRGARLVITADCGAAAHAEIAEASRAGLELIICDHHQNPALRPPAWAVLKVLST